jgi:carbon monoxide dehydrogenase subunit G
MQGGRWRLLRTESMGMQFDRDMSGPPRTQPIVQWLALGMSVLILVCPAWAVALGDPSAQRGFSAAEQGMLAAGKLVERPVQKRKGSLELLGGTSYQVIDAQPALVWQALLDTSRYHRMMPRVLEARLVKDAGAKRTVFVRQGAALVQTSYYLDIKVDTERQDITFKLDPSRPHGLKAAWGFYTVRPYGPHKTLLAYGIMADLGRGILASMMSDVVHEWMLKVPWTVKRFVEGSGRYLYKHAG